MIIEFCKFGALDSCYGRKEMTDHFKLLACLDCAKGMKFLHSNDILHRDLKPENLLVVSFSKEVNSVHVKLSDFGTSRFANQTVKMTNKIGTPVYMAPEVFNDEPYGKKSDVYSFGITVWAIFSEQTPFMEFDNLNTLFMKVHEGYRPKLVDNCPLNDIISACWDNSPSNRPTFEKIESLLFEILK